MLLASCSPNSSLQVVSRAPSGLDHRALTAALQDLDDETAGELGACVMDERGISCVNGDTRYSLQSVMKLLVAFAAFEAADRGELDMNETVVVRREDLSLYVQPIAQLVGHTGFRTTWLDLARRAVVDSDSAATDILVRRLGGPRKIQETLERKRIADVRIDRDERTLQTDIAGLEWRPEFVDAAALDRAIAEVPREKREAAQQAYLADVRDTATPRGMAIFLHRLGRGELLSRASTEELVGIMRQTKTFPGRLRAGANGSWAVGHKTGSSGSYRGVTTVTNDVGLYWPPGRPAVALAVFLAKSPLRADERDAAIAKVGRATTAAYQ